jgi:hypothetical protein
MSAGPVWTQPNTWQPVVEMPQQSRNVPLPFWPCGACNDETRGGSGAIEGRRCFTSFGPGRLEIVGCKVTGQQWSIAYPNELGMFEGML